MSTTNDTMLAMAKVVRVAREIVEAIEDGRGVPPNGRLRLREALNELDGLLVGGLVRVWRDQNRQSNG